MPRDATRNRAASTMISVHRNHPATHADIREHGQQLRSVGADRRRGRLPFVYTIGNHEHGMAELLLIVPNPDDWCHVMNALGRLQRERGKAFAHGEVVQLPDQDPVRLVDAGRHGRSYATQAGEYYDTDAVRVMQVILSDPEGRFPDEPGCDPRYRAIPNLSIELDAP